MMNAHNYFNITTTEAELEKSEEYFDKIVILICLVFNVVEFIIAGLEDKNPRANNQSNCYTPLHLAAENGHLKVVKCIMAELGNKNPRNPSVMG